MALMRVYLIELGGSRTRPYRVAARRFPSYAYLPQMLFEPLQVEAMMVVK